MYKLKLHTVDRRQKQWAIKITTGSRICVERPGNESLDRHVGIGRWKLSTDIAGSDNRRGRSTNSTCHGKWIGDSRLVDCHDPRCVQSNRLPPYTSQLFRGRRRRGASSNAVVSNTDRVMRRRRRGRRRKRSRRRRAVAVAERWTFSGDLSRECHPR